MLTITIAGCQGEGKTMLADIIADAVDAAGYNVFREYENGERPALRGFARNVRIREQQSDA